MSKNDHKLLLFQGQKLFALIKSCMVSKNSKLYILIHRDRRAFLVLRSRVAGILGTRASKFFLMNAGTRKNRHANFAFLYCRHL